jgi:hypothetical protein
MRLFGVVAVILVGLALAGTALAARQPTRAERAAITRLMTAKGGPHVCFPLDIRVSTRNSRYASAVHRSVMACGVVVGNGLSIVKRIGYRRWRIVETGSSLGCNGDGRVPRAVLQDLLTYCRP